MPSLTVDKNRVIFLNGIEVTSIKEGLHILSQLKQLHEELDPSGELKKSIEILLKGETVTSIDQAISGLSKILELENKPGAEQIAKDKLDELVELYEEKLKNEELTLNDILRESPNLTHENIQRLIDVQTELKRKNDSIETELRKTNEEPVEIVEIDKDFKKESESEKVATVKGKIEDLSQTVAKDLGVDEGVKQKIQTELEEIVKEKTLKSNEEEIRELVEAMANGQEVTPEIQMKAKEIKLGMDKWKIDHIEETREYQRVEFEKEFIEKTKEKNPNLTDDQLLATKEKAQLIGKVIFSDGGIENQKDVVLQDNIKIPKKELNESYSQLVVISGLLRQQSQEFERTRENYIKIDSRLNGVEQPFELTRARSFDTVMHSFDDNGILSAFRSFKNGGGTLKNISKYTGGWWEKGMAKVTGNFATKIGGKAASGFVKNSIKALLQNGLKGLFGAGAKAALGAAGPVGWIAMAAGFLKKALKGLMEKLGLGAKGFIEKNSDGFFGGVSKVATAIVVIPIMLVGAIGAAVVSPAVIGGGAGLVALNESSTTTLISTLRPNVSTCGDMEQDPNKGTIDPKCDQSDKVMGTNQCSPENSKLSMNAGCSDKSMCAHGCGLVAVSSILQCRDPKNTPKCLTTPSMGCKTSFDTKAGACPISWTSMSDTLIKNFGKGALENNGKKFQCRQSSVAERLCSGWVVIVHFRRSDGTGHWLVAAAKTSTGDIALADPSYAYADTKFNYWSNIINDNGRKAWPTYCLAIKADKI